VVVIENAKRRRMRRLEYAAGILGVILSAAIIGVIIYYWNDVESLEKFGYPGVFILSALGGASILAPVPVTPVVFIMGAVTRPDFAPYLGPVFIGLASGAGEVVGAVLVYMTGFAGGIFLPSPTSRFYDVYSHITKWMEKRGGTVLFVLSAVINPFFYPAAICAGAIHFGFRRYILICFIGKFIKGITVAFAGYYGLGWLFGVLGLTLPG
jgi:membrane protein YqaA with SNARE-associated domain